MNPSVPHSRIYTSFAAAPYGGNPAGVVVSDAPLDATLAQAVAAVLTVPTTAFVVAEETATDGLANLRFFTPRQEIEACGHATVAAATALVELGLWSWGRDAAVRTRGGDFLVRLLDRAVEMDQELQVLQPAELDWQDVARSLGPVRRHDRLPLAISGTGLRHLIVPLADINALAEVTLDAGHVRNLSEQAGVDTVCAWSFAGSSHRLRVRDLCPAIGALEEPASGTTSAALTLYLAHHRGAGGDYIIEQGIEMGRPSRIDVRVDKDGRARVRGQACCIVAGVLTASAQECHLSSLGSNHEPARI